MPERPAQADPARGLTARLPLKLITPTALVLPVVLVVSVIGAVVYVQGRAAAETLERRGVEQVHGRIADRLESLLDGPRRWHELVRRQIEAGVLDPDDLRSWRLSVYRQRHAFDPALAGVTWGDDTGRTFWVFRYPGKPYWELGILDAETDGLLEEVPLTEAGELIEAGARVSAFDPRTRPWYQLGVAAGPAGAWGEPYAWVAGDVGAVGGARTLGLPFAASVLDDDGGFLGVLDTELSLIDLSAFLGRLPIGRTGLAVITDRRGRLIATSSGAALADEQLNRAAALASEDPDVRAMQRRLDAALAENGGDLAGGWTGPVTLDRGVALMSVTRFKRPGGLDWRVMTAVPVADFTAEVNAIRRDGLRLVAVAVGVTLLLGMGLAAWMVRPLLRLRDHAQRVGGGDLDTPIHLREARELVELSGELNRMTDGLRDRLALRKSLRRASDVQRALLPTADPHLPGFDLVGHCDYCDETGGDYYDFLPDAETHEAGGGVVIGDVMGHGIASAMLMATARGVLRSRSRQGVGLADLLTHLNQLLVEVTGGMKFMTMLIVSLDPERRELRWASAGHDAPIVYRPDTDTFHEPEGGGLPLGVMEEEVYEANGPEPMPTGTVVLVATDGMWETRNVDGQMHGKDRLMESIRRHAGKPAAAIRDGLLDDLHAFRGDAPPQDDETFVVIKSTPVRSPLPPGEG